MVLTAAQVDFCHRANLVSIEDPGPLHQRQYPWTPWTFYYDNTCEVLSLYYASKDGYLGVDA